MPVYTSKQVPPDLAKSDTGSSSASLIIECLRAAGFAALPCTVSYAGWYVCSKGTPPVYGGQPWLNRKPTYSRNTDLITGLPLGLGLYLVAKELPRHAAKTALEAFGVTTVFHLGVIYAYCKGPHIGCWIGSSALIAAMGFRMVDSFNDVNPFAGLLALPFTSWMVHRSLKFIVIYLKSG